jgi:sugar phosphate isomerase/epimerase
MYPPLPKSYKGMYPFKLGTTSFIYPDHIIPNIEMLGPYLDEIELILFESAPDSLTTRQEIKKIGRLGEKFDLTYNVHLPLDIRLGAADPFKRKVAIETIQNIMDLTTSLSPSTFTLHLVYDETIFEPERIKKWQARIYQSMEQLLDSGIKPESISIENLDYPFEWVEKILNDFKLSVCIDLGHLMVNRIDIKTAFNTYRSRTAIIHLHGAADHQDHLSLDTLSQNKTDNVMKILQQFKGVVSLEVFSYKRLVNSLLHLEKCWHNHDLKM